jgi:RimJ/RimL family protein N-acetyltransferase
MAAVERIDVRPAVLEGTHVRLEPLSLDHLDGIVRAGSFDEIWTWLPWHPQSQEDYRRWIERTLERREQGDELAFATIHRATGEVAGSTRFMAISPENRRLEIGATWITPAMQRSAVNTEAKYLQLRHCFEELGCLRVEFKTDARNTPSRNAILRLGAVQEGVFRKHQRAQGGFQRDSVYFSIIDDEWPAVKRRLEGFLQSDGRQPAAEATHRAKEDAPGPIG